MLQLEETTGHRPQLQTNIALSPASRSFPSRWRLNVLRCSVLVLLVAADRREVQALVWSDAMALRSQAEVNLLHALNQKKARSASVYLTEQQQRAVGGTGDYEGDTDRDTGVDFKSIKTKPPIEQDLVVAQVRQLEHQVIASRHYSDDLPSPDTPLYDEHSQIKQNALRRRDAHMRELERYESAVKDISEHIEAALITTFDRIKESLADIDARLAFIDSHELRDRARLLVADKSAVTDAWDRLEALTKQRTQLIGQFATELERIEESRVRDVRAQLQQMTFTLMEIAHALGPEVERIIEGEAYQVNVVVIANRKVYADLVARLATVNVDVFVRTRLSWEQTLDRWRALRHARAIEIFKQTLNSPAFKDPEDRRRIMEAIRAHQQQVHDEQRLAALRELAGERAALTSDRVQQVLERLQAAQQQEEDANQDFFSDLRDAHDHRVQDAHALQEALRLELHGFGAMAKEGEIDEARLSLEQMLTDEGVALEDFFRMAGGLRGELDSIIKRLNVAELIYERHLDPLFSSVRVLLSAFPLENVMEAQGKGAERRALQTTLDKIRKASKAEMPALISVLQTQMQTLLGLEGISDTFKEEVETLATQLGVLVPETGESVSSITMATAMAPDGTLSSSPALTCSPTSKQSSTRTISATAAAPGSPPSATGTRRTGATIPSTDSSVQIDLQAVRRIQRRLAALVFASELPSSMQQHLQFISDQLTLQSVANRVVDGVVHRECDDLLTLQQCAGRLFLEEIGRRMEHQSALLHAQCEKTARFHLDVVSTVEKSRARATYVDLSVLDLLDTLKERDDDVLSDMEAQYSQSCAAVRHAPDQHELHAGFHRCAELLARMEGEYRAYEARVRVASEHNVVAADAQRLLFLRHLAALLGLVVPASPGAKTGMEQSDLDAFLSVKHVEELVDPPPPPSSEAVSTEGEGAVPNSNDTNTDASSTAEQTDESRLDLETLEVYRLPSGAELRCLKSVSALVEQILSAGGEEDESEAMDVKTEPDAVAVEVGSPASSLSPTPRATADDGATPEEPLSETTPDLQRSEIDGQLQRDWLSLEIPLNYLQPLVESFRDAVLSKYDSEGVAASTVLSKTRGQRFEAAAALLEERLRTHWPRRGRLDVQLFQPRLGELESHRQRTDRHVRTLQSRVESQQHVFDRKADEVVREIARERDAQVSFQAQLPLQASLAALQGLEARAKKGLAALKSASHDKLAALTGLIDSDTTALVTSSSEFVRACASQVFPDLSGCEVISGCDYHPEEVAQIQRVLDGVEQQARDQILQRSARVGDIRDDLERALAMWPAFKTRCQTCMQTLSMKEGLGQKFGLPRRTAQEKFRSEVTRCEDKSISIDQLLSSLEFLCGGQNASDSSKSKVQDEGERSRTILVALMQLRAKIYQRGMYFGFLCNTSQLEPLPLEFCPRPGDADALVVRDIDVVDELDRVKPPPGGFLAFVSQVSEQCRSDTKTLFQQEGKTDELPPSGVPDALEEYLTGQMDKARAFVAQQETVFHDQLRKLSELLLVAPGVAISDLLARAKRNAKRQNSVLSSAIDAQCQQFAAIKDQHTSELRPQLSSANNAALLEDLRARESERSVAAVKALREFRASSLGSQSHSAVAFELELLSLSRCLMQLLDTIIMGLEDVKQLSGEPLPKDKRKSLKRLRKVARVLESGDPKEVPRTDKELEALRQLGEAPRFPKRTYGGIPSFGVGRAYHEAQAAAAQDDEAWGQAASDELVAFAVASVSNGDGACEALLTPAHRALVRARDAAHADWVSFCLDELREVAHTAHERLEDEVKWRASWEQGITNMRKTNETAGVSTGSLNSSNASGE